MLTISSMCTSSNTIQGSPIYYLGHEFLRALRDVCIKRPLQMFGPTNGLYNCRALEKIQCVLILWIRTFLPSGLQRHKTMISQTGAGGSMGIPGQNPSYAPETPKIIVVLRLNFWAFEYCYIIIIFCLLTTCKKKISFSSISVGCWI